METLNSQEKAMETARCCAERETAETAAEREAADDIVTVEIDVEIGVEIGESTHDAPPQVRQMYQC